MKTAKYAAVKQVSLSDTARRKTIRARNAETGEACRYTHEEMGALVRSGKTDNPAEIRKAAFRPYQK